MANVASDIENRDESTHVIQVVIQFVIQFDFQQYEDNHLLLVIHDYILQYRQGKGTKVADCQ